MNMHDRMANGMLFTDMCEGLPGERNEGKQRMTDFNSLGPKDVEKRAKIMKEMVNEKSGNFWLEPPVYFCYGKHITIGEGSYINMNCTFLDDGFVNIGEHCLLGPSIMIATVAHPVRPDMRRFMYTDPVNIGNYVWIGGGCTICQGVTIGDNSVIGAGSVVVHDIPANSVAVGNPCKVIRQIDEHDYEYYYKDRKFDEADLAEEARLEIEGADTDSFEGSMKKIQ